MDLKPDQLTFRSHYNRGDRYFPFEANGVVDFAGYVQRPAAVNNTKRQGKGLWDAREKRIIQQPNVDERLDRLIGTRDHKLDEVGELEMTIASIKRAHGLD